MIDITKGGSLCVEFDESRRHTKIRDSFVEALVLLLLGFFLPERAFPMAFDHAGF
jgi:hypothetical protein